MPKPLSVDERLEAQFSSWDIAPVPEIPDLLMTLRTNGTTITLFK
ncbi:PilZ domain-containing protein, partial [Acidithiobacillus ferrivorans]|nr:PilZ domain-containing protein [Acidithiobacillus ferrivorans]